MKFWLKEIAVATLWLLLVSFVFPIIGLVIVAEIITYFFP